MLRNKFSTLFATLILATTFAMTGCVLDGDDDDCTGDECTSAHTDGVDAGPVGEVFCFDVCHRTFDVCGFNDAKADNFPLNEGNCITVCESTLTYKEKLCLAETVCDHLGTCF